MYACLFLAQRKHAIPIYKRYRNQGERRVFVEGGGLFFNLIGFCNSGVGQLKL